MNDNVLKLEVPMDDVVPVQILAPAAEMPDHLLRFNLRQSPPLFYYGKEHPVAAELHNQIQILCIVEVAV
jgi:hypothetical protein